MTHASGIDFSLFQFDRDLTMAAFFMNADKTIYGRFGTRTSKGKHANVSCKPEPDILGPGAKDVTIAGFEKAAEAALRIHKDYMADPAPLKEALLAKAGPSLPWKEANSIPALQAWRKRTDALPYAGPGSNSCLHCHQFATGTLESLRQARRPIPDAMIWSYPMPDLLGFALDPEERATVRAVVPGSEAERAGLHPGDEILRMEGQPVISVADVQWVLHQAPEPGKVTLEIARNGADKKLALVLPEKWRRRGSVAWRVSMAKAEADLLGLTTEKPAIRKRKELGLGENDLALRIDFPPERLLGDGQRNANRQAAEAGLKRGDVIVEVDGSRNPMYQSDLIAYAIQKKSKGDPITLKVNRNGEILSFTYHVGSAETVE